VCQRHCTQLATPCSTRSDGCACACPSQFAHAHARTGRGSRAPHHMIYLLERLPGRLRILSVCPFPTPWPPQNPSATHYENGFWPCVAPIRCSRSLDCRGTAWYQGRALTPTRSCVVSKRYAKVGGAWNRGRLALDPAKAVPRGPWRHPVPRLASAIAVALPPRLCWAWGETPSFRRPRPARACSHGARNLPGKARSPSLASIG
jgi:hypothetical protein